MIAEEFKVLCEKDPTLAIPNMMFWSYLGPVAQSIVSLTSSLRGQLVELFTTLLPKYTDIFC